MVRVGAGRPAYYSMRTRLQLAGHSLKGWTQQLAKILYSRRRFLLLAAVVLSITITLSVVAHTKSYDDEVLRYVSQKVKEINNARLRAQLPAKKCQDDLAMDAIPFANLVRTIDVPANMVYDPKGPKPSQIAILTASDGKGHNQRINNLTDLVRENRDAYAKHHGYIHHFVNITKFDLRDVSPVWKKIPSVIETFNYYPDVQWVFWIDADAIIMSPKQDLSSMILSKEAMRRQIMPGATLITETKEDLALKSPSETDFDMVDLIMAQDWNGINAGAMLFRRSNFTQWLLDMWTDPLFMYSHFERLEQDALRHILKHHATVRQHIGIAYQRTINAYPDHSNVNIRWQKGDFLVHLAGCWVKAVCQQQWDDLWPQRGIV